MADKKQHEVVIDSLVGKGWSREQAIGIAANLQAESNFNPSAVGDGGKAYGLAQWHPDRQAEFRKTYGKPIQGSTIEEQVAFVDHELRNGNEKAAGSKLLQSKSASEAADIITRFYERPLDKDGDARKRAAIAAAMAGEAYVPPVPSAKPQQGPKSGQERPDGWPVLPTYQGATKGAQNADSAALVAGSTADLAAAENTRDASVALTQQTEAADQAAQAKRDAAGFRSTFNQSLEDPRVMTTWTVLDKFNQAPNEDADAPKDYYLQNRDKIEAGIASDEEREFLRENVRGPQSLSRAQARLTLDRDADAQYGLAGGGTRFFGQAAASILDPVGLLAGAGVAKLFKLGQVGHAAYVAAGRPVAAAGALAGEAALGNIAVEGIADAMGETKTSADYVMAGAFGATMTLPFVRGTFREANLHRVTGMLDEFQRKAVIEQATELAEMRRQFPDATPAELAQRVQDKHINDLQEVTRDVGPQTREQMIPEDVSTEMRQDFEGVEPPRPAPEPKLTPEGEKIEPPVDENADIDPTVRQEPIAQPPEQVSEKITNVTERGGDYSREIPGKDGKPVRLSWWLKPERDVRTQASLRETLDSLTRVGNLTGVEKRTVKYLQTILSNDVLDDVRFRFSKTKASATNRSADFNATERTITVRSETTGATKTLDENLDGVSGWHTYAVIHETVHAATHSKIQAYLETKASPRNLGKLDRTMVKALQQFEDLHERYKAEVQSWIDAGLDQPQFATSLKYAGKNLHEFAAQLHSDPAVQTFLSNMDGKPVAGRPTSAWHEFINLLTRMLGGKKTDAFREGSKLVDVIIRADGSNIVYAGGEKALQAMGGAGSAAGRKNYAQKLYQHARAYVANNPVDIARTEVLMKNTGGVSDGIVLARSKNPIMQMVASLMMETTTGAAGRKANAGLRSVLLDRYFVGNSLIDYQNSYAVWRNANGGSALRDVMDGLKRREFDDLVYTEIFRRRKSGYQPTQDLAVRTAADSLEQTFERARVAQVQAGTLNSANLPPNSRGYIPQALDGNKLQQLSNKDMQLVIGELSNQFQANIGWDKAFSDMFAYHYTERVRLRAAGDKGIDGLAAGGDGAQLVRDTLDTMHLDPALRDRQKARLQQSGAMGQTKSRLSIDMEKQLRPGLRLMDVYVTNPELLARSYSRRTAGTVALTEQGVHGWRGISELRKAAAIHVDGAERATPDELSAFDRVVSEIMGTPSGQEVISAGATNLRLFVGLQRLGGLVIQQAAETFQLAHHLGMDSLFKSVPILREQYGRVGRMKKGQVSNDPILGSIDAVSGGIGMESYKMVAPLDAPDNRLGEYVDQPGLISRILRAGGHAQSAISGFRGLMAAQHRMVAEQIVHKAIRMVRDGGDSVALRDMGFDAGMVAALKADLPHIAQFDSAGRLKQFDLTQVSDPRVAEAFVQSVHRGTSQIIQGTFPGEKSKWASNDYLKLLLQLRQFGILAAEKQWARQRENYGGGVKGYTYAAGMMLGNMALAAPIYWARVQLNAAGREDRKKYLEDAYNPAAFVKGLMNYSSMTGFSSDVLDITSGLAGGWGDKEFKTALGAREQATGVGRLIPVAGTIDNALKVASGRTDLHTAIKQMPFSNLWMLQPLLNIAKTD